MKTVRPAESPRPSSRVHSIQRVAASYGYGLIRNHPYVDGNKRVGLVAMVAFLDRNWYALITSDAEVVEVILSVAAGGLTESALADWVASRTRPSDGSST